MSDVAAPVPTWRHRAFFIITGLAAALLGLVAFGWLSLILGWFEGGERQPHRVHDLGWGAVGGLIIAGGLLVQLRDPERKIAPMQQAAVGVVALLIASALSGAINEVVIFIVVVAVIIWLHPARAAVLGPQPNFSPILAGIAVVAAIPLVMYALDQIDIQQLEDANPALEEDKHWEESHWRTMAGLAFALPLVGLLAAMRTTGWLITARFGGAAAIVFGLASLILDDYASAVDTGWAVALLLGGIAFIAVAEREARSDSSSASGGPANY